MMFGDCQPYTLTYRPFFEGQAGGEAPDTGSRRSVPKNPLYRGSTEQETDSGEVVEPAAGGVGCRS